MNPGDILLPPRFLTDRQRQILSLIALGKSTKEIALELDVSAKTVGYHRMQLMVRLNLFSTIELTHYALATGLVENLFQAKTVTQTVIEFAEVKAAEPVVHLQQTAGEMPDDDTLRGVMKARIERHKPAPAMNPSTLKVNLPPTVPPAIVDRRVNIPKDGKWRTRTFQRSNLDKYAAQFTMHS